MFTESFSADSLAFLGVFGIVIVVFGVLRFKTNVSRATFWIGLLLVGALSTVLLRFAFGAPLASPSLLWQWLYYVGAGIVLDRARISQLEGKRTII